MERCASLSMLPVHLVSDAMTLKMQSNQVTPQGASDSMCWFFSVMWIPDGPILPLSGKLSLTLTRLTTLINYS